MSRISAILLPLFVFSLALALPHPKASSIQPDEAQLIRDEDYIRNTHARYQFATDVEDHINDLTQKRTEVREGSAVKGMYSYSDGYFRRTTHYEADDKGYRVVKQEVIPLELEGPKVDNNGRASVASDAHGSRLRYVVQPVISKEPIPKLSETSSFVEIPHP